MLPEPAHCSLLQHKMELLFIRQARMNGAPANTPRNSGRFKILQLTAGMLDLLRIDHSPGHVSIPSPSPWAQTIESWMMLPQPSSSSSQYRFPRTLKLFVNCSTFEISPSARLPQPSAESVSTLSSTFCLSENGTCILTDVPLSRTNAMSKPSAGSPVQFSCVTISRFLKNCNTDRRRLMIESVTEYSHQCHQELMPCRTAVCANG